LYEWATLNSVKQQKNEQNQLINEKVICMCPKMFDPRISETNSESPKFFLPNDSDQLTTFMFGQILKNSQISRNLKGDFQTFDPFFSVSTPQGQIKFNRSMGNYNLYRNTKLEQTWRNKKKVIHTFPKKGKRNFDPQYLRNQLGYPKFFRGVR
jgi:hypothetical protein